RSRCSSSCSTCATGRSGESPSSCTIASRRRRPVASGGRTALVTGAARGIGYAIATRLAADGARVALLDLDRAAVEAAAGRLGGEAMAVTGDVTRTADVEGAVQAVVGRWRRLDVLVNNAGITGR